MEPTFCQAGRAGVPAGMPFAGSGARPRQFATPRLDREWLTIQTMVGIYCRDRHHSRANDICPDCASLLGYAAVRLDRCRFGAEKPTCARCPVHCYQPARREQIRVVMRHSGPRMLWEHPVMTLLHWVDGWRSK